MQCVQDPNRSNVDNLHNARREASEQYWKKKKEYLKAKNDETDLQIERLVPGHPYDLKKGRNPRTNVVKDEKGDLVADSHSILAGRRNHFSQLLNVHVDNDVMQTNIHTAEPLVPEPSALEFEIAIEKLKKHKLPDNNQTPGELFKAKVEKFTQRSVKLLILFQTRRKCLTSEISRSLHLFIRRVINR
jgi:hypothetical protein